MRMKRKTYFTSTKHLQTSIHLNESPTLGLHIPVTLVFIAVIPSSPKNSAMLAAATLAAVRQTLNSMTSPSESGIAAARSPFLRTLWPLGSMRSPRAAACVSSVESHNVTSSPTNSSSMNPLPSKLACDTNAGSQVNVQPAAELSPKAGEAAEGTLTLHSGGGEHAGLAAAHEPRSAHVQVSIYGVNVDSLQISVSPIVQQRADAHGLTSCSLSESRWGCTCGGRRI